LRGAELVAEPARTAFRRAGVQHGWNVIDCGCGPLGGLAVLAEMVGPAGRVVGVDLSLAAVQRARAVVSALELGNVEVIAGGLHDLDSAALGGPFDLAFTRLFLMTAEAAKGPHRTATGCPVTGAEDSVPRREAGMAEEVTARVSRYILDGHAATPNGGYTRTSAMGSCHTR
jgi:SAM-dependent methyltransferase